jgi:hypothetical protein
LLPLLLLPPLLLPLVLLLLLGLGSLKGGEDKVASKKINVSSQGCTCIPPQQAPLHPFPISNPPDVGPNYIPRAY